MNAEWKVIKGDKEFFDVTKTFHNALQGKEVELTENMKKLYLQSNKLNANLLNIDYDNVVMHDPQPLAIINFRDERKGKWIWRCHIDVSNPNEEFWSFLEPFLDNYDAFIFSSKKYVKSPLKKRNVAIITPSIDPLSKKNKPVPESQILATLERYGVDAERPILTQVARFDPWKDPLGVIDVYRKIKKKMPKVQLLLITSMAPDDPEGWIYYERTARYAGEDAAAQSLGQDLRPPRVLLSLGTDGLVAFSRPHVACLGHRRDDARRFTDPAGHTAPRFGQDRTASHVQDHQLSQLGHEDHVHVRTDAA